MKEHLVSFLGRHPYHCECGHRFWGQSSAIKWPERRTTKPVEREIRATRALARRRIMRREFLLFGGALLLFATFLYFVAFNRGGLMDGR